MIKKMIEKISFWVCLFGIGTSFIFFNIGVGYNFFEELAKLQAPQTYFLCAIYAIYWAFIMFLIFVVLKSMNQNENQNKYRKF